MFSIRWAPTILSFPIGGWIAAAVVGPVETPLAAALAGAIAGAGIGAAQWWALRGRVNWKWLLGSIVGMTAGSAVATAVTDAGTTTSSLMAAGLITGVAMGAGQGLSLSRGISVAALWATTVGLSWAAGWAITANVIVDAEAGYVIFGLSGALLVTIVTGVVVRRILGREPARSVSDAPPAKPRLIAGPRA